MADEQELKSALKKIVDAHWAHREAPVYLSELPKKLEEEVANFRDVLGSRSLKAFILGVGDNSGFELIAHPTQSAKLGVAPKDANFQFPSEQAASPERAPAGQGGARERDDRSLEPVLTILRALRSLPSEELEKVVIPVSALVKLLK